MTEIEAEEKNGSDDDEADQDPVASTSKETLEPVPSLPATLRTTANTRRLLASAFAYLVRKAKEGKGSLQLSSLFAMMIDDVRHIEAKQRTDDRHGKQKVQEEGNARVLGEGIVWVVVESCLVRVRSVRWQLGALLTSFSLTTGICTLARTTYLALSSRLWLRATLMSHRRCLFRCSRAPSSGWLLVFTTLRNLDPSSTP